MTTQMGPRPLDYLKILPLYPLPHRLLSRFVYRLTRASNPLLKSLMIRLFCSFYRIDMEAAEQADLAAYQTFNDFFTRKLRADVRPVAAQPQAVVSPVDGVVSQVGEIHDDHIFQAKGESYSLTRLVGGDQELAAQLCGGRFVTLYLSPRDYHRIHMPVLGHLRRQIYVPGRLFPVNDSSTRVVSGLFARNERVVTEFETEAGVMALVLVGALFVGSMETVWAGEITPAMNRSIQTAHYGPQGVNSITLLRGAEMGRFNMGSTVILIFAKDRIEWLPGLTPGTAVRMGEAIATRLSSAATATT